MYTALGKADTSRIAADYAPLVRRMAHHLAAKLPASVHVDDIIQAGMIGLMDAATRYETGHSANFETFATPRIRGAMLDELRANDWMPRSVRRAQKTVERAITALEQRLGRAPGETEIARELKLSIEGYHELLNDARGAQLFHYDEVVDGDGESVFANDRHFADPDADPLSKLHDKRFRHALVAAIEKLPEREKTLMGLYYEQDLNFREIAAVFGVTESRVCQLHTQAVTRLRGTLAGW